MRHWICAAAVLASVAVGVLAAEQKFVARPANGLALVPPMGWNSWNHFGCDISEATIRKEADAMASSGMRDAGYQYVVIDDCWEGERDAQGNIQADPHRFPSGMRALADYVHSKGLKLGIYSDAGDRTCQGRPGSRGHEFQDALRYADWGVDYLKYDWCHAESLEVRAAYETMGDALRATGRPIVFSVCEWGTHEPWLWAASVGGNLWRTTDDIYDGWVSSGRTRNGVVGILDLQSGLEAYAGPGHWNDPDMLEVGNGGMSADQYRAHFSLWAVLAAPLMAGNDLSAMSEETRRILTNREVIAVDQDRLGMQGHRAVRHGDTEVWVKPLEGGGQAVVLLNRAAAATAVRLDWSALGLPPYVPLDLRDLWSGRELRKKTAAVSFEVPATAAVVLRATASRDR
ncbi:MAG TPA: glycoside hydrolase family 27 protein [Steroidobacteraceae bacterium]|nr:glycoside hydrolase family 27 protein [Steroidobacteraceae bacterium]